MTQDNLTRAARNFAHGLGIPVYIRDGRIYQHGPGVEFLPSSDDRPTVVGPTFFDKSDSSLKETSIKYR